MNRIQADKKRESLVDSRNFVSQAWAPPLTSHNAGGRLRRAHAGWGGANLCHLWNLWFQLLHLKNLG
jgi:hypothetical protein